MKKLLLALGAVTCSMAAPTVSVADNFAPEAVAQRINIAGRQRMLSQRMAKAACLMVTDISATSAFDQLTQSYDLFNVSDQALRTGNSDMGLEAETFPKVISALERIDAPWAGYKLFVEKGIDEIFLEESELLAMDEASLSVLKFMNIAVFKTARAYAAHVEQVSLGQAITVDIAGRQRMLTQKAVKEACLMQVVDDPQELALTLSETVQLFDTSLKALQDGFADVGVEAPKSPELIRKLREVGELWTPVKELLDRAASGQVLGRSDMSQLASLSEPLLATMNEAVQLYENE